MARKSTREEVLNGVLELVVAGELGIGDEARTSELWIAEQLGVSRTPVREALAVLAEEGVVVRRPQVGVWVRSVLSPEVAELCEDSCQLEVVSLRALFELMRPTDLEVDLRHALLDLEHAAARWQLMEPADDQFVRAQDAYLQAETDLHRLICERGGRDFAGRSVKTLEVKRRIFHVEHPIASDRVEALVGASTDLITTLLGATDTDAAVRALRRYYESLATTYDSARPESGRQRSNRLRRITSRLRHIEDSLRPHAAQGPDALDSFEALGELIDLEQLSEDAIPADDYATREWISKLIAEFRPLLSTMADPSQEPAVSRRPQAGDRRLVRARPMVIRRG